MYTFTRHIVPNMRYSLKNESEGEVSTLMNSCLEKISFPKLTKNDWWDGGPTTRPMSCLFS